MTIIVFLYIFIAVIALFMLYSIFNIYHLLRFGFATTTNLTVITLYIALSTVYLMTAFALLSTIDWNTPLLDLSFDLTSWL